MSSLVGDEPWRLWPGMKWSVNDRFLRGRKHVRVVDDSDSGLDIAQSVTRECSPRRGTHCISERRPVIDGNRADSEIRNCSLDRLSYLGIALNARLNDQRSVETSPE